MSELPDSAPSFPTADLPARVPRLVRRNLTGEEQVFVNRQRRAVFTVWIGFAALAFSFVALVRSEGLDLSEGMYLALLIFQALCVVFAGFAALVVTLNASPWSTGRGAFVERRSGPLHFRRRSLFRLPTIGERAVRLPLDWARKVPGGGDVTAEVVPARAERFWWTAPALVVRVPSHSLAFGEQGASGGEVEPAEVTRLSRPLNGRERAALGRTGAPVPDGVIYRVSGPVTVRRSPFSVWIGGIPVEVPSSWRPDLVDGQHVEGEVYLPDTGEVPRLVRLGSSSLEAETGSVAWPGQRGKLSAGVPLILLAVLGLSVVCARPILHEVQLQRGRHALWDYQAALSSLGDRIHAVEPTLCARADTSLSRTPVFDGSVDVRGVLSEAGKAEKQRLLAGIEHDLNALRLPPGGFADAVAGEADWLRSDFADLSQELNLFGGDVSVDCNPRP